MDIIEKAMCFSYEKHKSQKRKSENIPYFVHLLDVASILYKDQASEDLICAGFLHDVVEDHKYTGVTEEQLRKEFGDKITNLVMEVTEKDKSKTWIERKTESIEHLKNASKEVKILKCADKLSNLRDIYKYIKQEGEEKAFSIFNTGKEQQKFYYKSFLNTIEEIKDLQMYNEYRRLVKKVFD